MILTLWLLAWIVPFGVSGGALHRAMQLRRNVEIGRTSFWTDSSVPGTLETTDAAPVSLGLRFSSDVPGVITGIRFYKGPHNTGTHVGNLWSSTGTRLATVTFSTETASGWQQATFASPVSIVANTTYVISYFAPKGFYAWDQDYPWANLNARPLHVSGDAPGVFAYGPASTFPSNMWNGGNYWVDLVLVPSAPSSGAPSTPSSLSTSYTISGSVSGSAATLTLSGAATGSTTTDATGNYTFSGLANGTYVIAASQPGSAFTPSRAAVTVKGAAVTGVNFTAIGAPVPAPHSVTLDWAASTSSNIVGYNVYRGRTPGGPYAQIAFVGGTSYVDTSVSPGQTYVYVVTAVDASNNESVYSAEAIATIRLR
jgi:Domain of unknown function (DUF4082)